MWETRKYTFALTEWGKAPFYAAFPIKDIKAYFVWSKDSFFSFLFWYVTFTSIHFFCFFVYFYSIQFYFMNENQTRIQRNSDLKRRWMDGCGWIDGWRKVQLFYHIQSLVHVRYLLRSNTYTNTQTHHSDIGINLFDFNYSVKRTYYRLILGKNFIFFFFVSFFRFTQRNWWF